MESSSHEPAKLREAGEVFIFMHRIFRASRNLRAHWYIDHLGKPVGIQKVPEPSRTPSVEQDEYAEEMTVVGVVPAGGDGTEVVGDEQFVVTVNTKCNYISRYYRIVFVLDLSPSVVVADDESNCCLVDRLIPSLRNSLRSSVKPFTIPGTDRVFHPQVHTSICVFVPFLKFEQTLTLCQGVFVTDSNVDMVLDSVEVKFVAIFKRLFAFSRPILEQWGKLKRRHKHNKFDSLCESESISEDTSTTRRAASCMEELDVSESTVNAEDVVVSTTSPRLETDPSGSESNGLMTMQRGVWSATERQENQRQVPFASDKSYVAPDWSLIFMLRMGLLQIQMLPENTQSNLVVISDSVCGMPDEEALQKVLTQLRSYTVAFSFIQLQKRACTEPVFGHVGSSSLFHFMTMATFGTYLPRQKATPPKEPLRIWRDANGQLQIERTVEHDDIIDESRDNLNLFHRALICWSFQNALTDNEYLLDTFAQINRDFLELQQSHVDRHRRFEASYEATLNRMMYVRLREGFTLKSTVFVRENTQVILTLRLAFRPLVFIDYIITSAWPVNKNVHQRVNVELVLEAPYNELKDLLTESNYVNPVRMNLIKSVIDGIIDADRLLLHIHSFDTKLAYYTIPPGVTKEYALFQQSDSARQILPQLCIVRPDGLKTRGFVNFWKKMLQVDDSNWQKWVHTQTERGLLNLMHVPFEMFTTDRVLKFDCRYPLNAVLYSVKVRSSFCLVENQTYVTLVYASETSTKPLYFFIRKVICNGPVVIIKTAFLGGVTSIERRRAVDAQRQRLINVTYGMILNEDDLKKEARRFTYEAHASRSYMDPKKIFEKRFEPACTVFRRPLERMVVKYTHVPSDLTTIVRAEEKTEDLDEIMLITLHNTLAKTLTCRRSVIVLNTFQSGGAYIVRLLADFCQNVLMHKRINLESFKPAWTYNNTVSLLRQVFDKSGASLEQFIMFPAVSVQPDPMRDGRPVLKRRSRTTSSSADEEEGLAKNAMPSKTAVESLAIVCEMWNEPEGGDPNDQLGNMSSERRLLEDLRFISILFTLDKILRMSGQCTEAATPADKSRTVNQEQQSVDQIFPYGDRCRCTNVYELTGIARKPQMTDEEVAQQAKKRLSSRKRANRRKTVGHYTRLIEAEIESRENVPKTTELGLIPIRFVQRQHEGEEDLLGELDEPFPYVDDFKNLAELPPLPTVTDIHAEEVSKFVTSYSNLFSMTCLVFHAQRKYLPLPHFVLGHRENDKPRCNALQLNALHCQLSEICDLSWVLDATEQDVIFADLVKTLPDAEKPPQTVLRVYVKALTARMVALIFVPAIEPFDVQSESIPMFLMTVHESQIAHCYAHDGFDEHAIVNLPMSEVPERWDSGARFGWTPNNRNVFPEEATTFVSFVRHFEDEILPRIRMRAMYEAAQEAIPLNEDSLMDMSAEVDCLEFELSAIPEALKKVCKHFGSDEDTVVPSPDETCCRGSNIAQMFDKMLAKNFKKVDGTQTMFYLNPETLFEPKTPKRRRRRQRTRNNSDMMFVYSTETINTSEGRADNNSECVDDEQTMSEITEQESDKESSSSSDSTSSSESSSPVSLADSDPDFQRRRHDSLSQLEGEHYEEYTGKNQPMFIQFNCSVNFDGIINSFPISFLPTCIHELLKMVDDPPTEPEEIQKVEIVLELFVLTTQRLKPTMAISQIKSRLMRMAKSRVLNPYEFERQRRESYKRDEEDLEDKEDKQEDVLYELPTMERRVMTDLVKNVGVILELEKVLIESRAENIDKELLNEVKRYIEEACRTSGKLGHAERRTKPFSLVDNSPQKIAKFIESLENRECGYLKIVRLENSTTFYCRSIEHDELYQAAPKSSEVTDEYADFWIIITIEVYEQIISLHFCQRYAHQHTEILEKMWAGIRQELRAVNQQSLLELMYTTRRCYRLMVPEYRKITQFDENALHKGAPSRPASVDSNGSPMRQRTISRRDREDRDLPFDMLFSFREGYYACPLQTELWFPVPERLRNQSMLLRRNPLTLALENIKVPLSKYGLSNRANTFVYKDIERDQIIYFQLHTDRDAYELAVKGPKKSLTDRQAETIDRMLKTKICMTLFAIKPADASTIKLIYDSITERIDAHLLSEIMLGYAQNHEQPMSVSEVAFLQPELPGPKMRAFFSIPAIFHEFLPALLFYIGQHIEAIPTISPVKVKQNGVFYNGTAFMKQPLVAVMAKNKKKKKNVSVEEDIDQGVEAKEELLPTFPFEDMTPPEEPKVVDASTLFRSHPPIAGEMPDGYSLSSFFVYHILPASGVVNTGIALIEFRIVKPDGKLFTQFDQPSMGEQSHTLLVPNVLDDKATVYRDIIKSQLFRTPKSPVEKTFSGYVEMIVWSKGDIGEGALEKIMHELIEMSMFDVITEFGYLNTTIVEEGVLTGTVSFDYESAAPIHKQASATSVTASVDTRHQVGHHNHSGHSGEIRRSLVHGGSVDIVLNGSSSSRSGAIARMPSIAKDIEHSLGDVRSSKRCSLRRQDYMNRKNAYSIIKWLDYVASKQGETNSVVKQRIRFEFQHASLPALFEIRNRLEVSLGGLHESDIRERVYLCGLRRPSADAVDLHAGVSLRESTLSIFGTAAHDSRFEVLTTDPFHAMTEDCGVDESMSQDEYILVSCIRNVFDGYGENMIRTRTQVEEMKQMFRNHLHGKYTPLVQTHMYSPRQRIMMAYLKGDYMTIYFYNYHPNIHTDAVDCANKIVGFHNAKARLLREIGLHKMGITHLSPFHTEPIHEYDYEVLIWTDPAALISKEFPGEHKPPPAYMREPQCSNIFFRMYRQPDLQETMGRSVTLFKSECVRTMHYEQMLRWRSGMKSKIDFIQKVTRAHVEMIKKVPTIKELDLLLFLRPPKVTPRSQLPPMSSSSVTIRQRHHDDDHTEDNLSMTERTSKRASLYGESLKSHTMAESEIFKGKGEFLKKTTMKLDRAAAKFHEIRTPFFLRSEWNQEAPRRAGELFDEVVRESDIRLLLEEPLKEFAEIRSVQNAKTNKQLMKRKYSEKNAEAIVVSDVTVRNVEGDVRDERGEEGDEWSDDEDSDADEETRGEGWEVLSNEECGGMSTRSNSESRSNANLGEEDFQRTNGKVRRSWRPNPPTSPVPLDSRRNSQSSNVPSTKPSESGTIEKMFNSALNVASRLSRRLTRKQLPEKEPSIEKGEDTLQVPHLSSANLNGVEESAAEAPVPPMMYRHAEEFARYFTRKYGFVQFAVEQLNRRSKALNRYATTSTMYLELPYLVFYKAYDGGVIFADLRYEIPEFVVSFYMYERAKMSSADYYMIDQMAALYRKESDELHAAAEQLKLQDAVCLMTFNFDYHLRAVATFLDAQVCDKPCVFGRSMNVFHVIERLLDYYQHELILSKNLVAMKYLHMSKEQSNMMLAAAEENDDAWCVDVENDMITEERYAGSPIEEAICTITESHLYKTNLPVTTIELTGLMGHVSPEKRTSRVVPSIKLRVHTEDVGDGELWPPADDRAFIEQFEGRQRRRLTESIAKYGPDDVPTPWEDSCVRRTVREVLRKRSVDDNN